MAINFAAANMAGYNNPTIEVFEAVLAEDGETLSQYPRKSVILNCLNRGSVPFILITFGNSYQPAYLLPFSYIAINTNAIYFCGVENSDATILSIISICYTADESTAPEFRYSSITITA